VSNSIINELKVSILIIFERIFLPKADLIITVSRDTELRFLNRLHLDSNKIEVVYNNVLSPLLHSRPLFKKDKQIIGYAGHFSHLKGAETLLYAFFLLSKSINDVILVLVGDGPLREHFEDLTTRMGLQEKVIFTGWVKNPLDFMRDFDILVVPSLYEGCPSVILEAFSLDLPVLGSKAGGIPELLGHNELMFQPANHKELALKLKLLLACDEKYAYVKNLLTSRKKIFTFDHASLIETKISTLHEQSLIKLYDVSS
jgi:glycosyltransferase involved in cell wall biosynthesis